MIFLYNLIIHLKIFHSIKIEDIFLSLIHGICQCCSISLKFTRIKLESETSMHIVATTILQSIGGMVCIIGITRRRKKKERLLKSSETVKDQLLFLYTRNGQFQRLVQEKQFHTYWMTECQVTNLKLELQDLLKENLRAYWTTCKNR